MGQDEGVAAELLDGSGVAEPWETGTFAEPLDYLFRHVRPKGRDRPPTNAEVAAATGNAESTIQQLRAGKKPNPTMKTIVALAGFFVNSRHTFYAVATIAGSGLGAVQAASRALMASLIPPGKEAEMFGFYAFCGKSSSILGPLLFGGISYAFHGNQRFAVLSVALFFLVGLALISGVPAGRAIDRGERA